ncbi:MAG: hypothetical protein ACHQK9_19150 [Reyranellales bacterium]
MKRCLYGIAVLVSIAGPASAQTLPCALSEADYQSLANAKAGPLTPADIEALSPADQRDLCRARKFYREARGKDPQAYAKSHKEDDVPVHLARFTTSEEYSAVYPAGMAVMLPVIERGPALPKIGK